jgi:ABC-2 type transport system permease protein
MWMLSGAVFETKGAPAALKALMTINPLTYGMAAVRWAIYGKEVASTLHLPGFALSVGVTVGFGALVVAKAISMTRRPA